MRRERLEQLIADHGRAVLAYALRRTDPATADDVAAEVFVVAWRRIDEVPADGERPWLYGVARKLLANERRGTARRAALTEALGRLTRADAAAPPRLAPGPLAEALNRLRSHDRELLLLTAWEGLSAREAGLVLGCSERAVHTRLHRARARLERELSTTSSSTTEVTA